MENHKNEFQFSLESILGFVWRGIVVGLIAGFVVSIFRLAIEKIFLVVMELYKSAHYQPIILLSITVTSIIAAVIIGFLSNLILILKVQVSRMLKVNLKECYRQTGLVLYGRNSLRVF